MPLNTEITRNGKPADLGDWDYDLLSIMYTVATGEADPDRQINDDVTFGEAVEQGKFMNFEMVPIYYLDWPIPLIQLGKQTLKEDHTYRLSNGRTIELKAGDVLRAYRSSN
jgi:hypothetical protein